MTVSPLTPATDGPLQRILLATDGSPASQCLEDLLFAFRLSPGTEVRVAVVTAARDWDISEYLQATERTWGEHTAAATVERLCNHNLKLSSEILDGEPAHEVLEAARRWEPDLILVGSHGRTGIADWMLGSVSRNVVRHAQRPVVVGRPVRTGMQHVVVAVDGSAHAEHALAYLKRIPLPETSQVDVVHVLRPYVPLIAADPYFPGALEETITAVRDAQRAEAEKLLQTATERAVTALGRSVTPQLLHGDPAGEVLGYAEAVGADLIVAGSRGVSLLAGLFLGSVADRLIKAAHSSVLIVP